MLHLIVLGLILMSVTPVLTGYLKQFWDKNPMWSNLAPLSYSVIGWVVDSLVVGIIPWSSGGLEILIVALGGASMGKWGRDAFKYMKAA